MASVGNQQTWVPYEGTKDCSQGFCSIYCPQWCYIIFPPPPPFGFSEEISSSGPNFSPLVIAIIGILASAFLLISYYTIISKYCGNFDSLRRRRSQDQVEGDVTGDNSGTARHDTWHVTTSDGLDESTIKSMAVWKYKRGDGLIEGADCSVCLSEFLEGESVRLLPNCSHGFHVPCIDTWLNSHSNCPLCRANIVWVCSPPPTPSEPVSSVPVTANPQHDQEAVASMEDLERGREVQEEANSGNNVTASKGPLGVLSELGGLEEGDGIIEIGEDGIQPIRHSVSIADVLRMSMEDDLSVAAKDRHRLLVGGSSSRQLGGEEHGKNISRSRALHCVMSPVPMKRSFSSGRFCFARHGKCSSSNSVLPI